MSEPTLNEVFEYWFIDNENECWRDRRTNKIVCYFNKDKKIEPEQKAPNAPTTE